MSQGSSYAKAQRTIAKNARLNAAVIRRAAERPENHTIRTGLMLQAERYDVIATAAEGRATKGVVAA